LPSFLQMLIVPVHQNGGLIGLHGRLVGGRAMVPLKLDSIYSV
jgi:hypothetical protein